MSDDFAQLIRELDDCAKRGIWSDKFTMSTATRARDALRTLRDERDSPCPDARPCERLTAMARAHSDAASEASRLTAERDAAQRALQSTREELQVVKASREQCQAEVERLRELLALGKCPNEMCDGEGTIANPITVCCGHPLDSGECCGNGQIDYEPEQCQWCDERRAALKGEHP